jgi:hypothetical protein
MREATPCEACAPCEPPARPAYPGGRIGRPEPPSVLRVRAGCGGRLFTAKLGIVVHYLPHQLLDHLLASGRRHPAASTRVLEPLQQAPYPSPKLDRPPPRGSAPTRSAANAIFGRRLSAACCCPSGWPGASPVKRPCLHCMIVELIDDFFAEYPARAASDKVD